MSFNLRVKGNITTKVGGTTRLYAKEGVEINSNGKINYYAPEYLYGDPEDPPVKIMDGAVKEIELLTALDLGSDNIPKSTKTQLGMIFGNTYHFKVKSYVKKPPANLSDINWMLKYKSPSQNKWLEIPLSAKGDSVKITLNDEDMCGRYIYVRAYVNDPETEAEYKEWKHNRFRWFNRFEVHQQINDRVKDPWKIDQKYSSLCGMSALYYAMIKRDPKAYENLAKELFRTGEYKIGTYVVKPHEKALSMYETKPTDSNYKSMGMSEVDWIVLATTRSKESLNSQFVYNGFENGDVDMLKAVNWPDMLTRMCKEVAGYTNAESFGLNLYSIMNKKGIEAKAHDYVSNSDLLELQTIEKKYNAGHTILMMIDSDMIEDVSSYNPKNLTTNSHWVVYEGGLTFYDIHGNITTNVGQAEKVFFSIYTWGFDPVTQLDEFGNDDNKYKRPLIYKKQSISIKSFKSNYYGYIEAY
ncbi:hypothetical protein [Flavobacterium notoginsengisoli]|uniref:hypothetical protein n=1 Tax=Flavobacterium notoginsengisoli TaxID=1478199 RepID=UPI0036290EA5